MTWRAILDWIGENRVGDLVGILGLFVSLIGFFITIVGVTRSQGAARRAEEAAKATRDSIRLLDTVMDFSAAISTLEEIKRMHRRSEWNLLPDRYSTIRKLLITLRSSGQELSDTHSAAIQAALTNLRDIETQVEKSATNQTSLKAAKFNSLISADIDNLLAVLNELKAAKSGG